MGLDPAEERSEKLNRSAARATAFREVLHEEIGDEHAPIFPELVDAVREKACAGLN